MNLEQYLNENFTGPFSDEFLKEHFKSFGVYISIEGNKFLFKYDQIEANWNNLLTSYCRGAILRYEFGEGWKYLSRPWNKFFNRYEGKSGYSTKEDFKKLENKKVELLEKCDGSAIQIYHDPDSNSWKASTLGSISTSNVFDFPFTFSELFWKIFGENTSKFEIGNTYLFELCTTYNRVVTEYDKDMVFFLGAYSNASGDYLEDVSQRVAIGLKTPTKISFTFKSWEELEEFVEKESNRTRYGKNPEGFVCYVNDYPAFKCKNRKYLELHGVFTGDKMFVRKNIVSLFFHNQIDDIEKDLPKESKEFLEKLRAKYILLQDELFVLENYLKQFENDRKEYSIRLQEKVGQYTTLKYIIQYFYDKFKNDLKFSDWALVEKNGRKNFEKSMEFWKEF